MELDKAIKEYKRCYKNKKDVSRGGKDYASCSFMDICLATTKLGEARVNLVTCLGEIEFDKITDSEGKIKD